MSPHLHSHTGFATRIMIGATYQRHGTIHVRSYEARNSPTDRPAMNSPAQVFAQNMSQQTNSPEDFIPFARHVSADASYFKTSMPETYPRATRQARFPTLHMGLQSRPGQKRHLDDYDQETEAGEQLHKRLRPRATRQVDEGTTAHEQTSGTTWRQDDAAKAEHSSREGRWVLQHGSMEDPFRRQGRGNLNTNSVESSQGGTAEAKQRRKVADVGSSGIAPLNINMSSCGALQDSDSLRPIFGSLKKKVRFEDEISGKVLRKPACLGNSFSETPKEQLAGSGYGPHIMGPTQREVLNQPADADVIMVDV